MERIDLSETGHARSLERLCASALSAGDFATAFMYADRRCRIRPLAKPHHYTMRAEALMRLGDKESAIADLRDALLIAPEDIPANRRLLAWADAAQQVVAAEALVSADDDPATLMRALRVLRGTGRDAIVSIRALDDTVSGWTVWNGDDELTLSLKGAESSKRLSLAPELDHPLIGCVFENVASFNIRRDQSSTGHGLVMMRKGETVFSKRLPSNCEAPVMPSICGPQVVPRAAGTTVIVPIYRDLAATRACLESLEPEICCKAGRRAILVNDGTPEPKLAKYLKSFARKLGFKLLVNSHNLGFVESVNRALGEIPYDDVILLNADTIVPRGFIERLSAIAHADPSIGTVTPFSNNGEFTSFPVAFTQNPLPSVIEIKAIDEIAAEVNHGAVIDLPNGIGFCMFISRGCLGAVGRLSQSYGRGYLEDVDFCLRARDHGFRNVCAPSIFVGHHGSRSFGGDKRPLVVRNVAVVEAKFPDYRQECALFMAADPLRSARAALGRRLRSKVEYGRLLVSGSGLLKEVAEWRAEKLRRADGKKSLLLHVSASRAGVELRDATHDSPQSLMFSVDNPTGLAELRDHLEAIRIPLIEILDPAAMSLALLELVTKMGVPVDVVAADAGAICPRGTLRQPDGNFCSTLDGGEVCFSCVDSFETGEGAWRERWQALSRGRLEPPCTEATEFSAGLFSIKVPPKRVRHHRATKCSNVAVTRIGIVVQGRTVDEFSLIQDLLRRAVCRAPGQTFVVVGSTFYDLALIGIGNAFVSGEVAPDDQRRVLRQYGIGRVFLPLRRPLFGHPSFEAAYLSDLPLAYFDWSFSQRRVRAGDLAIDPRCDLADLAAALGDWGGF